MLRMNDTVGLPDLERNVRYRTDSSSSPYRNAQAPDKSCACPLAYGHVAEIRGTLKIASTPVVRAAPMRVLAATGLAWATT